MLRRRQGAEWAAVAVVLGLLTAVHGQPPELPPVPVPVAPPAPVAPPQSPLVVPPPPPIGRPVPIVPSNPVAAGFEDHNGPVLQGDPLLDRPQAPPGWFGAVEVGVLVPHIKDRLTGNVFLPGLGIDTLHLPATELDAVAAPRFELGYRFGQGFGEVLASYRFLQVESEDILRTRLDLNVLDLDYGGDGFCPIPHWELRWRVGARLANVYFDSFAVGANAEGRTSNYFFGAGPHVSLDLWRSFDAPGLGLFARLEGAVPVGRIHQSFQEDVLVGDFLVGGATSVRATQAVPTLGFQVGLGWASPDGHHRYAFGYQLEQWWSLGKVGDSNAELLTQGLFLRGEFGY